MILWSAVRWYDRLGGVLGVLVQMTAITIAVVIGVILLVAGLIVFAGPHALFPIAGLWGWGSAYLVMTGRWQSRRHYGHTDEAKTTLAGMLVTAPIAIASILPLTELAIFCAVYLASYLRPAIWLELAT